MNKRSTKYSPGTGPAVPQSCPETGSGFQMGGPMWAGPIHDPAWIQGLLDSIEVHPSSLSVALRTSLFVKVIAGQWAVCMIAVECAAYACVHVMARLSTRHRKHFAVYCSYREISPMETFPSRLHCPVIMCLYWCWISYKLCASQHTECCGAGRVTLRNLLKC